MWTAGLWAARSVSSALHLRSFVMCGVAGILDLRDRHQRALAPNIAAMTGELTHRGPDGDDVWVDGAAGVAFGQRRFEDIPTRRSFLRVVRNGALKVASSA